MRLSVGATLVVAAAVVAAVTLSVRSPAHCLSTSATGNTVVHQCEVRPEWANQSSVLVIIGAALAVLGLLLGLAAIAVAGGLAATVGLAWALGDLFIHWWAPTPTAENSSPPPEAGLFVLGSLSAVAIAGVSLMAISHLGKRRTREAWSAEERA